MIYLEIPLVDEVRLDELRSMDEDGSFVKEIIDLFASDSESSIRQLATSVDAGDLDQTRKVAHRLKGSALSLGANRFAALTSDIEHDNELDSIRTSLTRLVSLREETLVELESHS